MEMDFNKLQKEHIAYLNSFYKKFDYLFEVDISRDDLWKQYLDSFKPEQNPIHIKKTEHDCSCCRQFIKNMGNVVGITKDYKIVTIWDFETETEYSNIIKSMADFVQSKKIVNIFYTKFKTFGQMGNHSYKHFYTSIPEKYNIETEIDKKIGQKRDSKNVFQRSLEELSKNSIEIVLELINQNSLYKGEEWKNVLNTFLRNKKEYDKFNDLQKDLYCWLNSVSSSDAINRIRNHSIGTLLIDISNGEDIDLSVTKYEKIVAPTNYKRPKAIITKNMITNAEKTIKEMGLEESLERRFTVMEDITANNVLFANRNVARKMKNSSIFEDLKEEASSYNPKNFSKVEEILIEDFIENVLPTAKNIEILFDNKLVKNLVSLTTAKNSEAKPLFKWNNNFGWAYNGNITDSFKQDVKNAGGNVDAELRFSIRWNENDDNKSDLDAHCKEPGGNEIYYGNKNRRHPSSGMLDVDYIRPQNNPVVENITWIDRNKMPEGIYNLFVHCFSARTASAGFSAEIEFDGQIHSFNYKQPLHYDQIVEVAKVSFSKKEGFKIVKSLDSSFSTNHKEVWNISTNNFHPVNIVLYSPNHWNKMEGGEGTGNKHYFFMIKNCINPDNPNGFFNEYLKQELTEHKRVFEVLGSRMKVEDDENQLSGLGFSSTLREQVICKVEGNISRLLKIIF